ncbi:MAG TPA: hypothetical protein VE130_16825 [Nitrososphaeraceae archaeon]|nr:hypothetical protein [Nitrososphaeraceae archaeon]
MNSKLLAMSLIASTAAVTGSALLSTQNVLASICPPMCAADIDEEEETAAAGNATMMANQTADGNMTGMTNSTS